jgi:putative protease
MNLDHKIPSGKKPELLVPAGGPEALRTAVLYGADAVYLGGPAYGLRAKARNFTMDDLREGIAYAHAHNVKVHVTVNIIAHEEHFEGLPEYLRELEAAGADALIVADAGIFAMARKVIPDMALHLSTQASATNSATMEFWHQQGAKRIVAARECSLEELAQIRQNTPEELELETFVHGAMCISISGRCLLSNYMTGKDANLGECVHPCRWQYRLMEETRPGEYFPVVEEDGATYFFNSKDLCMIGHIPELVSCGIASFKIEGRMKTPLYVAMTAKAYREAIDDYFSDPELYEQKIPYYLSLLGMVSHRGYTTGFYFGKPGPEEQVYESSDYEKEMVFAAKKIRDAEPEDLSVSGLDISDGWMVLEQRGKFTEGETLTVLSPHGELTAYPVREIRAMDGTRQESANHAMQLILVPAPADPVPDGTIFMRKA